ncbi:hypothetical protein ASE48_09805 [Mycobacterium sp. Root265]|nr:hypothetical protein ASE48_09805 [Mycobacterium sp. Root265]
MIAGVAAAGAAAIAVNPIAPTMPTLSSLPKLEQHAVELAANPLADLGDLFKNTVVNAGVLGQDALTSALPSLAGAITNPAIYADFVTFLGSNVFNPLPALQQLGNFNSLYSGTIGTGLQAGADALKLRLDMVPTVITNTIEFLRTGQFVEAFSEVNVWFLVSIERALVPLLPALAIPGDVLSALPNGERLAAVFDTVLKRGIFTEFTRSILGPFASAGLQFALALDAVRAAAVGGDAVTAISELVALPVKVTNAFVNGFVPPFTSRSPWTGILGERGTLDYFLHDLPKALADAFNNPVYPVVTPPVTPPVGLSSTVLPLEADTVTLDLQPAILSKTLVTEVSTTEEIPTPVELTEVELTDTKSTEVELTDTESAEVELTDTELTETPGGVEAGDETSGIVGSDDYDDAPVDTEPDAAAVDADADDDKDSDNSTAKPKADASPVGADKDTDSPGNAGATSTKSAGGSDSGSDS